MPELPEVEAARRLVERHCQDKLIEGACIADDDKVIQDISSTELASALKGRKIEHAHRLGKHLWLDLADSPSLMFHFGMTGSMLVRGVAAARYRNFVVDEEDWPPKYWKVQLDLSGGVQLAFTDPRRFARVRLVQDPLTQEPLNKLGFDPILSMPSLENFKAAVAQKKRQAVKNVIMDQSFSAGVGNWVADEVLYQAAIHPEHPAAALDAEQVACLHAQLSAVPTTAIEADADSSKFPSDWLFHVKWNSRSKDPPKLNGNKVEYIKVGGRTTAFVPAIQKLSQNVDKAKNAKASNDNKAGTGKAANLHMEGVRLGAAEGAAPLGPASEAAVVTGRKGKAKGKRKAQSACEHAEHEDGDAEAGGSGDGDALLEPAVEPVKARAKDATRKRKAANKTGDGGKQQASAKSRPLRSKRT